MISVNDLKKYEDEIKYYDTLIKIMPDNLYMWFSRKGHAFFNLKIYEEAISCYNKLIVSHNGHVHVWYNIGCALFGLERYEEAINCFDKVIEIDPMDVDARSNKEYILQNLENVKKAR